MRFKKLKFWPKNAERCKMLSPVCRFDVVTFIATVLKVIHKGIKNTQFQHRAQELATLIN
jgi:hypothetical protein